MKPAAPTLPADHVGFFDSHCHIDPDVFGDESDAVVERAREAGVRRMIAIGAGYGPEAMARAVDLADRHAGIWAAVGLHPHDARLWTDELGQGLRALARRPRVVALGEMGLDFHYDSSPRDDQRRAFRAQIRIALELGLPIVIHDRESQGETQAILEEEGAYSGAGVLYHCFTGDVASMRRIVALGGYISIPGIVTFKSADVMRQVAAQVPADRLLVETDSPFLSPVPLRGTRNEPRNVAWVAADVAVLRGVSLDVLAETTSRNTAVFFRV